MEQGESNIVTTPASLYAKAQELAPEADEISVMSYKQTGSTTPFESYTLIATRKGQCIAHASCFYTVDEVFSEFITQVEAWRRRMAGLPPVCPACGQAKDVTICDARNLPIADGDNVGHECDLHSGCVEVEA